MNPLIEAVDLKKIYSDGTKALRGASFSINKGELVTIMGPSGSGKSTLLHILGFLDPQTSGVYKFSGNRLKDFTQQEIAHVRNSDIGFVFQSFNLMPRQTVVENVCMPLFYSSVPKDEWRNRAETALEQVGLAHRFEHKAFKLSGGEKQRVAIARALINKPKVIFADEPTGNLDTRSGNDILKILKTLHDDGHTVVIITHDKDIAHLAERMLFIRDGKLESDTAL